MVTIHVLWATSPRYSIPQFVTAFSDSMVDALHEEYRERREAAELEWRQWGDDPQDWTFWTTVVFLAEPAPPREANDD